LETATLCFPLASGRILLARKAHKVGAGKLNGFGGKLREGESLAAAASRELYEEIRIRARPEDLDHVATITFHRERDLMWKVYVFLATRFEGEPRSTPEMQDPTWYELDCIPFGQMLPADPLWIPMVLAGRRIVADVDYSADMATVREFIARAMDAKERV
jgi:ADP-ribose pyrophosphatase YjhB (NUDIX family)